MIAAPVVTLHTGSGGKQRMSNEAEAGSGCCDGDVILLKPRRDTAIRSEKQAWGTGKILQLLLSYCCDRTESTPSKFTHRS